MKDGRSQGFKMIDSNIKNTNPKVSIIIPVYNGANYIKHAIDSALDQTYNNTEVLVINDGSTDNGLTEQIAQSYGDRIRYIKKENGGVASALNMGIENMSGDLFAWLSHDDVYKPHKVQTQVDFWVELGFPQDKIIFSDYELIDSAGTIIRTIILDRDLLESKPLYAVLRGSIHGCTVLVPRAMFQRAGLFDINLPTTQDYDLWFRMTKHGQFIHLPEPLIYSRWHEEQGSKKGDHSEEITRLWSMMANGVPDHVKAKLEGSPYRFLKNTADFLGINGLTAAAQKLMEDAERTLTSILVSVIIPVHNEPEEAISAFNTAIHQTHPNIEIILVDDGSTDDMSALEEVAAKYEKAKIIKQPNQGPAQARNTGWSLAKGTYVAFLDADDLFIENKIEKQLRFAEDNNAVFTHTSYWRHGPHRGPMVFHNSGHFGGTDAFPRIICGCPIATPTVMIRANIFSERYRFPTDIRIGEDVVLWTKIAEKYGIFGLNEPLNVVRAGSTSAAYNIQSQMVGLRNILMAFENDPIINSYRDEIAQLNNYLHEFERSNLS